MAALLLTTLCYENPNLASVFSALTGTGNFVPIQNDVLNGRVISYATYELQSKCDMLSILPRLPSQKLSNLSIRALPNRWLRMFSHARPSLPLLRTPHFLGCIPGYQLTETPVDMLDDPNWSFSPENDSRIDPRKKKSMYRLTFIEAPKPNSPDKSSIPSEKVLSA